MPTQAELEAFAAAVIPKGTIIAWYAKQGAFPRGWNVCDGSNGTPDLRGRFIRGVSDIAETGKTGGNTDHTHHYRWSVSEGNWKGSDKDWGQTPWAGGPNPVKPQNHEADTDPASNLPPYVDVIYLMKT